MKKNNKERHILKCFAEAKPEKMSNNNDTTTTTWNEIPLNTITRTLVLRETTSLLFTFCTFFHTVVWSHVGMEGQVDVVVWFLRRAASFNINITPFARVCTREDQPKKLLKSFFCYICINGNVLERICKSLDLRFSFTFSFVISTKNVTLFGWYPWRTVRNETQRWNITIKIHPAEVVLEASMTSKLFNYFVHQRKYPGLGVFGSAVHRAYRSNVMPCDTEGVVGF